MGGFLITHSRLRSLDRHELKTLLVEAHRQGDWDLARKLSIHWEREKRKVRCEVCGVRLSRVTIPNKEPNRFCRMHNPRRVAMRRSRWLAASLVIFASTLAASPPRPNARFTAAPSTGYDPLMVTFTNQTTGNVQGNEKLSFGDGGAVLLRGWSTYTHPYAEAGSFNATLTVSNKTGFTIAEQLIVVTNRPSSASVSLAWNPSTGTNVAFYTAYMGFSSYNYSSTNVTTATNTTFTGLSHGTTYFFNVDCTGSNHAESAFNHEISYTP